MKKIVILLLSLIFYTCSTSSDPNDPDPKIYLTPATSELSLSDQSTLSLMIQDNQKPVFGLSLQIEYNNSVLSFSDSTGFATGNYFDQSAVSFVRNEGSIIHLSFSQLRGELSKSGSGTVCSLTFNAIGVGNSNVEIKQNDLRFYDHKGNEITISNLKVGLASINVQ